MLMLMLTLDSFGILSHLGDFKICDDTLSILNVVHTFE